METLGIDWKVATMDQIRVAYIRHIRAQAAGHKSEDGLDLVRERVLTERVDRELKQLQVEEKRGRLINVEQLEPELMQMVGAFRSELLSRDDKLADELNALYGIDVDRTLLNEHTRSALSHLSRYDIGGAWADQASGDGAGSPGAADDDGMGAPTSPAVGEIDGQAGEVQP